MNSPDIQGETEETSWIRIVSKYNRPNSLKSWLQFSINLFLYSVIWVLMFESLSLSYWITLGLSIPAAGMLVRLFIIYHDCGHGSYFKSRKLRDLIGIFFGILTFTPLFYPGRLWRWLWFVFRCRLFRSFWFRRSWGLWRRFGVLNL